MAEKRKSIRHWVQFAFSVFTNGYLAGFAGGRIFTGRAKGICLPGLNCYSCPGALGSCPIGALQSVLGSRGYHISFYVFGFLMLIGAVLGRFVCGWLCPFGLIQDLLHKIPFPKKYGKIPGDRWLRLMKWGLLIGFVILLPLYAVDAFGQGKPWFCKYVCPSGTLLAGLPLVLSNPSLRQSIGWLFAWKNVILVSLLLLSVIVYRPFCRYLCPLGAIYGLFNPIAFCRIRLDTDACTSCGACRKACKLDISPDRTPNNIECIRCGDCIRSCPHQALSFTFPGRQQKPGEKLHPQ